MTLSIGAPGVRTVASVAGAMVLFFSFGFDKDAYFPHEQAHENALGDHHHTCIPNFLISSK